MLNEKESSLLIDGPAGVLEVSVNVGHSEAKFAESGCWALICHPHPQHGGTMENKVVTTLMRTYRDLGISVVRFNFRGVGRSGGTFDHAKGELDDLMAVIRWLIAHYSPKLLCLAGFSFGSSIAARASFDVAEQLQDQVQLIHLTLVAPPVERYAYDREKRFPVLTCIIQGDLDERVNAQGVYLWREQLLSATKLIRYPEATHFFHGYLAALKTDLSACLEQDLPFTKEVNLQ